MPQPQAGPGPPIAVGGAEVSFAEASISAVLGDGTEKEVFAFKEIGGESTVTPGIGLVGGRPAVRSSGELVLAGNVTLWQGGKIDLYRSLEPLCREKGLVRDGDIIQISLLVWTLVVRFSHRSDGPVYTRVLVDCRITKDAFTASGGDPLEAPLELNPMDQYEIDPVTGAKYALI